MIKGKKILVVDDDYMLMDMYSERVSEEGAVLFQAKDGNEAISIAKKELPDAILLDIMMPGVDGFGVLRELKADEKTKNIPIIVLTALANDAKQKEAIDLGAADYLVKSQTLPGEVIKRIDALIAK